MAEDSNRKGKETAKVVIDCRANLHKQGENNSFKSWNFMICLPSDQMTDCSKFKDFKQMLTRRIESSAIKHGVNKIEHKSVKVSLFRTNGRRGKEFPIQCQMDWTEYYPLLVDQSELYEIEVQCQLEKNRSGTKRSHADSEGGYETDISASTCSTSRRATCSIGSGSGSDKTRLIDFPMPKKAKSQNVTVFISSPEGELFCYKLNRKTSLKAICKEYCLRTGHKLHALRFMYEGELVFYEHSADFYGMKDGDIIDVHFQTLSATSHDTTDTQ
ncbi:uncharacterized protein [Ptychodera flava]|uniref:uncharacterized protein n=1 Tax=Ptychodera flava TaxID=63121 RepID=UPI00396A155A